MPRIRSLVAVLLVLGSGPLWGAEVDAPAPECFAEARPGLDFGTSTALSDGGSTGFMPALAVHDDRVLIAWQETGDGHSRIAWAIAQRGCVGPVRHLEESLANPRRPAVAATASGWVLAYEAQEPPRPMIRFVELDTAGEVVSQPETLSEGGEVASRVRVVADGDDMVFSWTNARSHYVARRGPVERLSPTAVGTELDSGGLINFPRIALGQEGQIYLAYRDGGPRRTDFEVRLQIRQVGESFSKPINVSRSRGLMSDDVALAVESDGKLRLVWVEQDHDRPDTFEVVHSTLDSSLEISKPQRLATLGLASFKPSAIAGPATVWQAGTTRLGRLYFAEGAGPPMQIVPVYTGGMTSLDSDSQGNFHLAFVDGAEPPTVRYAWRLAVPQSEHPEQATSDSTPTSQRR